MEGRTDDGIRFENVGKEIFNAQTDRANEAIQYLKSKSTTEMIRAARVWVAERIELKKAEHKQKNEPRWKRRIEGNIKRLRQVRKGKES